MIQGRPTAEESPSWFKRKKQRIQAEFLAGGIANSLEKSLAPHSSNLAWRIPGTGGSLEGCCLWGRTESDTTEAA